MKTGNSSLRVIAFMAVAFFLLEFTVESGEQYAVMKYPIIWAILVMLLVFAIAIEIIAEALRTILYRGLTEEAKERYLTSEETSNEKSFSWFKKTYSKMLGAKPMENEEDILLDHNYDGIKELDNTLPPWWVYMFYATILFAAIYLVRYEVFGDTNQAQEYEIAVAEAKVELAEYKKTAKGLVDVNTVELLTEIGDLSAGKAIFTANCIACHKADGGGGIGPNLTDSYWILGGGIKNVFTTITQGGRAGKGMISWKSELSPLQRAQVSSYLLGFEGTTPADPKAAEGDIWIDQDAPKTDTTIEGADSKVDSSAVGSITVTN
ncbi:MAG: cytochrome c oxidase cbb3-type subunit 3 [Sediminicola sp.]|jgi:cytochrome c oxidase cbb3-type subunit 3